MLTAISRFFHHLFNPHCALCEADKAREETRIELANECKSCDVLRQLLESEKFEKKQLLNFLMNKNVPGEPVATQQQSEWKPIGNQYKPIRLVRESLEAADRAKAFTMAKEAAAAEYEANRKKSIPDLENELLKDVKAAGEKEEQEVSNG